MKVQSFVIDVILKNYKYQHLILLNYVMEMIHYDQIYHHVKSKDFQEILIDLIFDQVIMVVMFDIVVNNDLRYLSLGKSNKIG